MSGQDLREVILEFHHRAFGEELARVNFASREERWAYLHRLWARIQRATPEEGDEVTRLKTRSHPSAS